MYPETFKIPPGISVDKNVHFQYTYCFILHFNWPSIPLKKKKGKICHAYNPQLCIIVVFYLQYLVDPTTKPSLSKASAIMKIWLCNIHKFCLSVKIEKYIGKMFDF